MTAACGCVILTMGQRPTELTRAVASVLAQRGVELDCLVVGNGWAPHGLPEGVRTLALPENVGATAGRNAGIPVVHGEVLLFLDDDAVLPEEDIVARAARMFAADPTLGVVQPRVVDPHGRPSARRHVPRLWVGDPRRSSDVTSFWEGGCFVRRSVLDRTGGFAEEFFYLHEGIDLAWRVIDAGFRVHYAGHLVVHHPATPPSRHSYYHYLGARNRVWLARRHLPAPLAAVYVTTWFVLTVARLRSRDAFRDVLRGYRDGVRAPCGARRPISWRAVWRMTRVGRPPVI